VKKFLGISGFLLLVLTFNITTGSVDDECIDYIYLSDVNSNNLMDYIKNKELPVLEVCANNFCDNISELTLEKGINKFIDNYYEHIKKIINHDDYLTQYLKGFKIDKIKVSGCLI